jgi:thiosulfate/3-mercaptopyruvate sulfurtransferase
MKKIKFIVLSLVILLIGTQLASAQGDIISAAELSKKIKAKEKITIVSVRKASNYKKSHLKNAVNIDLKKLVSNTPPEGFLHKPAELAKIFGSKGIDGKNLIVIYDDGKMKYAGRLYWIFKYLGVKNVKVLNRNLKTWKAARLMITKSPTKIKPTTFTPKIDQSIYVDIAWMKTHYKDANVVLIDVRPLDQYNGTSTKPLSKGHIPGAKNMNYEKITNGLNGLKSKAEIKALSEEVGATTGKTIVLYCGSSTRAGIVYLAFKTILGYPNVKVYEGAYNEWVLSNPVEK